MKTPLKKIYKAFVKKLSILVISMIALFSARLFHRSAIHLCHFIQWIYQAVSMLPGPAPMDPQRMCCGAMSPDVCVEFSITLAPGANGISFNIASGAVPPGALYYQINCGPIVGWVNLYV
jgi:hypothetical protein